MTQLTTRDKATLPIPADADKDTRYRVGKFSNWMEATGAPWYQPDLRGYRDYMNTQGYAPATISAHLSTVRGHYAALLRDRARFFALVTAAGDFVNQKALVDELIARITNAIDPAAARVKMKTRQDVPDDEYTRLTSEEASALIAAPGVANLAGLRDTSAIALMLCTGIREAELSALDVTDLRQHLGGELALHVREGKGCKERLIPYGELSWVLAIIDRWLAVAGIEDGAVFRGIYKGGQRLRPGRLSVRAIQYILDSYPVMVRGEMRTVKPHDLRRTYARRLFKAGVSPLAIQQNLGHADLKTTLGYIGDLNGKERRAPAVYDFDLRVLNGIAAH